MTKERKLAVMMSLLSAAGNLGVIAITINAADVTEFISILPTSPRIIFVLLSGLLSLTIGLFLLLRIETSRKAKLTALAISIAVVAVAAIQMSIVLGFVLFWPWTLYKLYQNENA